MSYIWASTKCGQGADQKRVRPEVVATPYGPGKFWPALVQLGGSRVLSLSVPVLILSLLPASLTTVSVFLCLSSVSNHFLSSHPMSSLLPVCFPFSLFSAPFLLHLCSSLVLITCVWCMCVCCWCVCVSVHLYVRAKGWCQLTPSLALWLMLLNLFYRIYLFCVCECVYV